MSPTRAFMMGGRKLLVFVFCSLASILYLTFLIFNYKDEIRYGRAYLGSLDRKLGRSGCLRWQCFVNRTVDASWSRMVIDFQIHWLQLTICLYFRLLEDSSTSLKQKQDNLAAQLQVAQEQKSRLQNQVDLGIKSLKVLKDEYVAFRYDYFSGCCVVVLDDMTYYIFSHCVI